MELLFFPGFRAISLKRVIFVMSFDALGRESGPRAANLVAPHRPVHARDREIMGVEWPRLRKTVRVVPLPQESKARHIKLRVIDGLVERLDLETLPWQVQHRVAAVLAPLQDKTHLQ